MSKIQNTIAIICDCDETLAPDTTSYLLKKKMELILIHFGIKCQKMFHKVGIHHLFGLAQL